MKRNGVLSYLLTFAMIFGTTLAQAAYADNEYDENLEGSDGFWGWQPPHNDRPGSGDGPAPGYLDDPSDGYGGGGGGGGGGGWGPGGGGGLGGGLLGLGGGGGILAQIMQMLTALMFQGIIRNSSLIGMGQLQNSFGQFGKGGGRGGQGGAGGDAYNDGYQDGFNDGYNDGVTDTDEQCPNGVCPQPTPQANKTPTPAPNRNNDDEGDEGSCFGNRCGLTEDEIEELEERQEERLEDYEERLELEEELEQRIRNDQLGLGVWERAPQDDLVRGPLF